MAKTLDDIMRDVDKAAFPYWEPSSLGQPEHVVPLSVVRTLHAYARFVTDEIERYRKEAVELGYAQQDPATGEIVWVQKSAPEPKPKLKPKPKPKPPPEPPPRPTPLLFRSIEALMRVLAIDWKFQEKG